MFGSRDVTSFITGDFGRVLERALFNEFIATGLFEDIYTETDLRNMFGWNATSIDYMLVSKAGHIILLQSKWRKTKRRETKCVMRFLRSVEHVVNCAGVGQRYTFGIWAARCEPFEDNKQLMQQYNIHSLSSFDSIVSLVSKTKVFLGEHLSSLAV